MALPYLSGPRAFTFSADGGDAVTVSAVDSDQAHETLAAYVAAHGDSSVEVVNDDGHRLELRFDDAVLVRARGDVVQFHKAAGGDSLLPAALLFFQRGFLALNRLDPWHDDPDLVDKTAEEIGTARAAAITTEPDALARLGRVWADSGTVDPSGEHCVFFDPHGLERDAIERAEVLALLAFLGMQPVSAPDGSAAGEVWVRLDERLDAELDRWA